jgi:hypothetical protein
MSKLYNFIESQVNNMLQSLMTDESGRIQFNSIISTPAAIRPWIATLTTILFVMIMFIFGIFIWNQGLATVFPGVVARIEGNGANGQVNNKYIQLLITLVALNMLT